MKKLLFSLFLILIPVLIFSQNFTRQDSLRGSITPQRAWWDLTYYHLDISVDPDNRFIKGAHREETDFLFKAADQNIKIKFDPKSSLIHLKGMQGGIRNFNKYEKTFLEIYGELFFNIKNFKRVEVLLSLFILLRKYFITKNSILNPHIFFINIAIFIYSFIVALKSIIKGCDNSILNKNKVDDILL